MAEKSKYDIFKSIFGSSTDNRVKLYLHELQKESDKCEENKYEYLPEFVKFSPDSIPIGMQNKFYNNKIKSLDDKEMHPEWYFFFGSVAGRLTQFKNNQYGANSKVQDRIDFFTAIRKLQSWRPKTFENFIAVLMNKIIVDYEIQIKGDVESKSIIDKSSDLNHVRYVNFKPFHEIYTELIYDLKRDTMDEYDIKKIYQAIKKYKSTDSTVVDDLPDTDLDEGLVSIDEGLVPIDDADTNEGFKMLGGKINPDDNEDTICILCEIYKINILPFNTTNISPSLLHIKNLSTWKSNFQKKIQESRLKSFNLNAIEYITTQIDALQPLSIHDWINDIINLLIKALYEESSPLNKKIFSYNVDKYFIGQFLEEHILKYEHKEESQFWNELTDKHKYYRKNGILYTKINDEEVEVDRNSKLFKTLKVTDKCLGTGLKDIECPYPNGEGTQSLQCTEFISDCLLGKNIEKCKDYLKAPMFWTDAKNEVDNMLPEIALRMLRAFEFNQEEYFNDTYNQKIKRVQSVDNWLKKLDNIADTTPNKLSKADIEAIGSNTQLLQYIRLLVKKINDNPAILNVDFVDHSISTINEEGPHYPRLSLMGVPSRAASIGLSESVFERLKSDLETHTNKFAVRLGLPLRYGSQLDSLYKILNIPKRIALVGGNSIDSLEESLAKEYKQIGNILESHYFGLKNRLHYYNKDLDKNDENKILALIDNLKNTERKLLKAILYTEKYATLLEIFGIKDNTKELSLNYLKYFVDARNNYFNKVTKKQDNLLSIFKSILESINKQVPTQPNSVATISTLNW